MASEMTGPDASVDLPRLVVLVRARVVFRLVALVAVVALPVWLVVVVVGVTGNDASSPAHAWFADHATRGFVSVATVLVVDVVLALVLGRSGEAGALAARLVPLVGRRPDPVLTTRSTHSQEVAILDAGNRDRRVPPPHRSRVPEIALPILMIVVLLVVLSAGLAVPSEYRASRGEGGLVVTLGEDARITGVQDEGPLADDDDSGRYFLATPRGRAYVDAARRPDDGSRFVLVSDHGGLRGIEIGGHDWLEDLIAAIVAALVFLGIGLALLLRRRSRVVDPRLTPLATTLTDLVRGRPCSAYPWTPTRTGPVTWLTVTRPAGFSNKAARRDADAAASAIEAELERRTRLVSAGLIAVLLLVGVVAAAAV